MGPLSLYIWGQEWHLEYIFNDLNQEKKGEKLLVIDTIWNESAWWECRPLTTTPKELVVK